MRVYVYILASRNIHFARSTMQHYSMSYGDSLVNSTSRNIMDSRLEYVDSRLEICGFASRNMWIRV